MSLETPEVIAIDGPVAAGKTAVGKLLAERLGYRFLDTGIMYRAVTWLQQSCGVPITMEEQLGRLARNTTFSLDGRGEKTRLLVNGHDVSQYLRLPEVERNVSLVASVLQVRKALVEQQKVIALQGRMVMVGRDIGTVVLPNARLKVFLIASPEERARRRYLELRQADMKVEYKQVLDELVRRDALDSTRQHSPLQPAPDAHMLETDGLDVQGVVNRIMQIVEDC